MQENLFTYRTFRYKFYLEPMQANHLSPDFYLAEGRQSHSEPESSQLTGNWQKRENTESRDVDEEHELHQLMEDIKSYIRSIDIGNL